MTRTARDSATVLRAIAGSDVRDLTAVDRPFPSARRRPRVAILANATKGCMPAVKRNFETSIGELETFCDLTFDVALPEAPYGVAVSTIVDAEGASAFREFIESGRSRELRQLDDRIGGYAAYTTPAVDYIDAMRQRTRMVAALAEAFGAFDAVASPTLPTVTYPIGVSFDDAYPRYPGAVSLIAPGNLAGLPALAMPNGFGPKGLPTGLSLLGQPFAETRLTAIGERYQAQTSHHAMRPPQPI